MESIKYMNQNCIQKSIISSLLNDFVTNDIFDSNLTDIVSPRYYIKSKSHKKTHFLQQIVLLVSSKMIILK